MRGLGAKIALILIASIVAVVLVATLATALVLNTGEFDRLMSPMARHIVMTTDILLDPATPGARRSPPKVGDGPGSIPPSGKRPWDLVGRAREEIVTQLPAGTVKPELSAALQKALAREGEDNSVQVIDPGQGDPIAALKLDDGRWILYPFPKPLPLPPQLWWGLGAWLCLMVIGVVAVALVMAHRVTRPFVILENAIASVGSDGILPHTPEVGSGEARQTAAALNALSDRLKAAMESRMRLVAAAGHDLRTPMTRMRLRAEFLSDEERASWLTDLDELDAIADSAIHLVKEEGAGEDRGPVALDVLVRETAAELAGAKLPVVLQQVVPATVTAGPLALKRALRNLVTNAATHGGGARVSLGIEGEEARIAIEDDGPGIPEALIPQVFEPFFRANPGRTQTIKGAGLGLAIAREIIERFGGTIEIRNRPEGGLLQLITLKVTPAKQAGGAA
jgi:signal transduction histidine kinase